MAVIPTVQNANVPNQRMSNPPQEPNLQKAMAAHARAKFGGGMQKQKGTLPSRPQPPQFAATRGIRK